MKTKKKIFRLRKNTEAVAGIVVAVMIVGLILAVVSLIQIFYIPKWMKSREAEHLSSVGSQFSQLKNTIDTQALNGQTSGNDLPISTSITLGSENLGFLTSQRAYGYLNIIPEGLLFYYKLVSSESHEFPVTVLKYMSENAYYIDQSFILEGGGIILNQEGNDIFLIKPSLSASYSDADNKLTLSWNCINLVPVGGINSLSGYGTYPIQTKYIGHGETIADTVNQIKITTDHPEAWKQLFIDTIQGASTTQTTLTYGSDPSLNDFYIPAFTSGDNGKTIVTIDFYYGSTLPNHIENVQIDLNMFSIDTQFSPGWIG
jgi:hypothetical protein